MKIIYCLQSTYNSGGMERIVISKANYLKSYGYEVVIITTNQKGKKPFFGIDSGIRCIDLDINYDDIENLSFITKLIKRRKKLIEHRKKLNIILAKEQPDVTISTFGNEIAFLHKLKSGGKKIAEIHFTRFYRLQFNQKGIWRLANRWLTYRFKQNVKKYDAFVCLTKEDSLNWNGVKNIHVIPNFIDSKSNSSALLESKVVIAAGRLSYQKGYDRLLNAWQIVHKHCPEWHLDIYGSGEEKSFLQDMIQNYGINSSVFIKDPVKDIYDRFNNSSLFVLSSRYEGLPMVMLEAMGCGLPIVSFDCQCGPKDLLENTNAGLLVQNGNIKELAEKIILLIQNKKMRQEMGKAAYDEADKYLPEHVIEKWISLIKKITNK